MLYHNPVMCGGVRLDVATVAQLAQVPNIVGIKDSAGDLQTLIEYIEAGESIDNFLEGFPTVRREQVIAFLEEAKTRVLAAVQ